MSSQVVNPEHQSFDPEIYLLREKNVVAGIYEGIKSQVREARDFENMTLTLDALDLERVLQWLHPIYRFSRLADPNEFDNFQDTFVVVNDHSLLCSEATNFLDKAIDFTGLINSKDPPEGLTPVAAKIAILDDWLSAKIESDNWGIETPLEQVHANTKEALLNAQDIDPNLWRNLNTINSIVQESVASNSPNCIIPYNFVIEDLEIAFANLELAGWYEWVTPQELHAMADGELNKARGELNYLHGLLEIIYQSKDSEAFLTHLEIQNPELEKWLYDANALINLMACDANQEN